MFRLDIYARDKNGNRGPLISSAYYPTKEEAEKAKSALIWLCVNQRHFPKEWRLKRTIITGPVYDEKYN